MKMTMKGSKKSTILSRAVERSREKRVAVTRICSLLGIARSTFYRKARGPGRRESEDSALRTRIEAIQEKHGHCYGINRVTAALRRDGHDRKPGHNQVARVMTNNGLNAVTRRRKNYRVCMKKGVLRDGTKLENTLDRQFDQQVPDKVFATDVSYIATTKGWLYVSPVIDLCTREIIACEMSMTQDLSLAFRTIDGLHKAVKGSLVLHSDQGYLYTNTAFRAHAKELGMTLSYSRKGNCWDNAVMENWNGMLKTEWYCHPRLRHDKKLISPEQAMKEIEAYIDYWNNDRIQARLKYRSPKEFKEAISHSGV